MLAPAHRGKKELFNALFYRTLAYFARENYEKVFACVDPHRLPALYLYLLNNCTPVYDSLYNFIQWRRIQKRLKPMLNRAKRRESIGRVPF